MKQKVHPLRIALKNTASATTLDVETDKVKTGDQWKVDRIMLRNQTRANSDVVVYINTGAYNHAIAFERGLADNEWSYLDLDLILKEGESLVFSWSDIVSSDVLDSHITGERRYQIK